MTEAVVRGVHSGVEVSSRYYAGQSRRLGLVERDTGPRRADAGCAYGTHDSATAAVIVVNPGIDLTAFAYVEVAIVVPGGSSIVTRNAHGGDSSGTPSALADASCRHGADVAAAPAVLAVLREHRLAAIGHVVITVCIKLFTALRTTRNIGASGR